LRLDVDGAGDLGAVLLRACGDACDVGLVRLAEVGGIGKDAGALLLHPQQRR